MGFTINERTTTSGETRYRVAMRLNGNHFFSLTFVSREVAFEWVQRNEKEFFANPLKFHTWKQELYLKMREKGLMVYEDIVRPKYQRET